MLSRGVLLTELRRLTSDIELDLRSRIPSDAAVEPSDPVVERFRDEYRAAVGYGLTAATWQSWLDEQVSQVARAWVLATVVIRFCEDNGLLDMPFAAGPADASDASDGAFYQRQSSAAAAELITSSMDRLRSHPAMASVFSRSSNPLWRMRPSHEACRRLLAFWRRRTPDGALVHDFTDESRSTRFLTDLYADISEHALKSYASVPTPPFVVELIHDLALDPALDACASGATGLSGFRVVDPACGSGAFLLDAYERLFRRWSEVAPGMSPWQRAARALNSVHGCDLDPCAVSITRFRLLLAAMNSTGERRLEDVPDVPLVVATGDSLLHNRRGTSAGPGLTGFGAPTDVDEYARRHGLLRAGSYQVVTTNPPYITVKDKRLFTAYRDAYESCNGLYALSVPFTELAFDLALPGEAAGRVGLLTSNSFMKREFGRSLVERVLPRVRISHVIDTSGAYIPGHGTPTVILVGQNRVPDREAPVHMVVGRRGEPGVPEVPGEGLVWQSLRRLAFEAEAVSHWAESYLQERAQLDIFPWSLAPSAARSVLRLMESGEPLRERVTRIGYAANTGSDELFCSTAGSFRRHRAEESATVRVLTGSEVRDWSTHAPLRAFFPRTRGGRELVDLERLPGHHRRLWPYRGVLSGRRGSRKTSPWYDWHQFAPDWDAHPWSIVFPWVATHPHFSLLRGSAVALNSAPVIKLPPSATEHSHLELLGVLNSSAVCFWLKQMSQSKGQPHIGALRGGEAWERIYEFTSTRLLDLPLPPAFSVAPAEELDLLAAELGRCQSDLGNPATRLTAQSLAAARGHWSSVRSRMVAIQEELDWQTYASYGLLPDDGNLTAALADLPGVEVGERAFEIALARRIAAGETEARWFADDPEGSWFRRHDVIPVTEIPEHWPPAYQNLVRRRVAAIEQNGMLALLEQPEYKRRWLTPGWDTMVRDILRERMLDLCEAPRLWLDAATEDGRPVARSVRKLSELLGAEEEFTTLAALYAPRESILDVLLELLAGEHVPQAAPLRYKPSGLNKRRLWEELWEVQRLKDSSSAADDRPERGGLSEAAPVLPRFTSADFLKSSYWRQRGKFDMPNERFTSFASSVAPLSPSTLIGWAGWDAGQRAHVLLHLLEADAHAHTQRPESALPLLRALADVLPWARTEHGLGPTSPPGDGEALSHAYEHHVTRLGLSAEEVNSWRPPTPKRGRPRKAG
ncbi:BREX-2 system adenine-specific DNA-methyltransferase PglX [Streptomyces sp. NPDC007896]|uniref:BREX-2 system adenine-specific DNA-methyltransferase PglX n=1 Tax=Streptomyces sp. NPDC007896 TaxID=3364784 RepID=UPI0036E17365